MKFVNKFNKFNILISLFKIFYLSRAHKITSLTCFIQQPNFNSKLLSTKFCLEYSA